MGENKVVNPMYETLGQRLKRLREAKGLNPNRLGKNARVDPGYIARIEKGEIKNPGWEVVLKLAEGLDTTLQYIYTGKDAEPVKPASDMSTDDNDLKLLANIFTKHGKQEFHYLGEVLSIPIKGHVSAGRLSIRDEERGEFVIVKRASIANLSNHNRVYALIVDGDSLQGDGINSGDTILIYRTAEFDIDNKIYVIRDPNTNECVLRHLVHSGDLIIAQSSNPAYKPLLLKAVEVLGRVIVSIPPERYH